MTTAIPAFKDNYIWCLEDPERGLASVVDPGDPAPVIAHLDRHGLDLGAILITHHHRDHTGGIQALHDRWPLAPVYGPANEAIPLCSQGLGHGDRVTLAGQFEPLVVLGVPGHTRDHIAYYGNAQLFCGDTLFTGGCGALFEGTPAQMFASLERLAPLPGHTRVYCAHEYTLANLRFALKVDPDNRRLQDRVSEVETLRAADECTLPSTIGEERQTNPFLRSGDSSVKQHAESWAGERFTDPVEVFAAVRAWKDAG